MCEWTVMHVFSLFLFPIILLPRIGDLVLKKFVSTAFFCGRMSQIFSQVLSGLALDLSKIFFLTKLGTLSYIWILMIEKKLLHSSLQRYVLVLLVNSWWCCQCHEKKRGFRSRNGADIRKKVIVPFERSGFEDGWSLGNTYVV